MNLLKLLSLITVAVYIVGCSSDQQFKERLQKAIDENPEIVFKVIEDNPAKFMMTVQSAAKNAQKDVAQQRQVAEAKKLNDAFENPLRPVITKDTLIKGPIDAPITIVEYSDFECPFCARGHNTVEALMKKYPGKVRFIYKHLPLSFHPNAMISSQYFEAIALQSPSKAFKFHDEVFKNQSKLKKGETFLTKLAKDLKVDLKRLKKDINSDRVSDKIDAHIKEAKKFGIQGTPGFVMNGIPIKGAYPAEHFEDIINKLKAKGKLKI